MFKVFFIFLAIITKFRHLKSNDNKKVQSRREVNTRHFLNLNN